MYFPMLNILKHSINERWGENEAKESAKQQITSGRVALDNEVKSLKEQELEHEAILPCSVDEEKILEETAKKIVYLGINAKESDEFKAFNGVLFQKY